MYGILLVSGLASEHQKLSRFSTIFGVNASEVDASDRDASKFQKKGFEGEIIGSRRLGCRSFTSPFSMADLEMLPAQA